MPKGSPDYRETPILLQAAVLSAVVAHTWNWTILAALLGALNLYLVREPLIALAWNPKDGEARTTLIGVGVFGALACVALVTRWPIGLTILMGSVAAAVTWFTVRAGARNAGGSALVEIISGAGLTASSLAVAASACRGLPLWALWLWGALVLHTSATILVAHVRSAARIQTSALKSATIEHPVVAYGAQWLMLLAALALANQRSWWLAGAMALPAVMNWFELRRIEHKESLEEPLEKAETRALNLTFGVHVLLAVGFWGRGGCAG